MQSQTEFKMTSLTAAELDVDGNAFGLKTCTWHVRLARQRLVGVLVRRYPVVIGQLLYVVLTLKTNYGVSLDKTNNVNKEA